MKRILLYVLMALSMAVFAQQQAGDSADDSDGAQTETEQPADAGQGSEDEALKASAKINNADEAVSKTEKPTTTGQDSENESREASEDTDPDDRDFKPDEEISEDYPVPLPSDI